MIGIIKPLLWKTVGKARLTEKELETALWRVETTINSRPITYQYSTANEPRPLTQNDLLLVGQRATLLPILLTEETKPGTNAPRRLSSDLNTATQIVLDWQERWQSEYLSQLAKRFDSIHRTTPIKTGEIVLIEVENQHRRNWITAVIQFLLC